MNLVRQLCHNCNNFNLRRTMKFRTIFKHELQHVLGSKHEHARPDRDDLINVNLANTNFPSQFTKLDSDRWLQHTVGGEDQFPYEVTSSMHYCSYCGANSNKPVMTYKDGSTFGSGVLMTTTDALQLQWRYCKDRPNFELKETVYCTSKDKFNVARPIFPDRVCDGQVECAGGEDEISNGVAAYNCIRASETSLGCCGTYLLSGVKFGQNGTFSGRDVFVHPVYPETILFSANGNWYLGRKGLVEKYDNR